MSPRSFDVVVVGAGPAGIAAAARAAELGARTLVVDEGSGPGGQIWRPSVASASPVLARRWIARLQASGALVRAHVSVVDAYSLGVSGHAIVVETAGVGEEIQARVLILATGARERFLPFPGWTLPNVVGIGGAQALLKSGTSFRGRRVVIAGSGPLLLPVAASLAREGARVMLVAEQAPRDRVLRFAAGLWHRPSMLVQAAVYRAAFARTPYRTGTWVESATGTAGVGAVTVTNGRTRRTIECDTLCTAFGLVPNIELARLLGCAVQHGAVTVDVRQATTVAAVYCAGEPTGIGGMDLSLVEGEIAGIAAAGAPADGRLVARRAALRRDAAALDAAFALRPEVQSLAAPDTIVCRCEDVRLRDLDPGWTSRQAKLYSRAGMGPCQGRICGSALECVMGERWSNDSVRPPIQPARVATLRVGNVPGPPVHEGAQ